MYTHINLQTIDFSFEAKNILADFKSLEGRWVISFYCHVFTLVNKVDLI